jgi:hypothetical protein
MYSVVLVEKLRLASFMVAIDTPSQEAKRTECTIHMTGTLAMSKHITVRLRNIVPRLFATCFKQSEAIHSRHANDINHIDSQVFVSGVSKQAYWEKYIQ